MNRCLFFFFLLLTLVGTAMGQQPTLSTAADPAWFYIQVLGDGDRTDRVMTVTSDGDVYGRPLLTSNDMAVAATQLWRAERSGTGYLFYNRATGSRLALRYDRDRTIAIATTLADATRCVFTLSRAAQGHGDYLNIVASTTPPGADADEVYLHQANSGGGRDYAIMQVGAAYAGSENSAFRFVPFEDFDIKVSDEASTHWYRLVCTADGRCAAVAADSSARPFVLVESDEASAAQQWKVLEDAAGRLTLVNRLTSKALGTETVADGMYNMVPSVVLGAGPVAWTPTYVGSGQYTLSAAESDGITRYLCAATPGSPAPELPAGDRRDSPFAWRFRLVETVATGMTSPLPDRDVADGLLRVSASRGIITVEGHRHFAVHTAAGQRVSAARPLPPGLYLVSAGGLAAKVLVE